MNNEHIKDQTSYLIAFLAALIGLGTFKAELADIHIQIFSEYPSFFAISVWIVLFLLASAYLSAISYAVSIFISTTLVPLRKLVNIGAYTLGLFGLLIPVLLSILWVSSLIVRAVSVNKEVLDVLTPVLSGIVGLIVGYGSVSSARQREATVTKERATQALGHPLPQADRSQKANKEFIFLQEYEQIAGYMRTYLEVIGYSARNISFHHLVKTLASKGVLSDHLVQDSRWLSALRNNYAHGHDTLRAADITRANKIIMAIEDSVEQAFLKLVNSQESA